MLAGLLLLPACGRPLGGPASARPEAADTSDTEADPDDSGRREVRGRIDLGAPVTCADPEARARRLLRRPAPPGNIATLLTRGSPEAPTAYGLAVGDFDGDGHADLFVPHRGPAQVFRGDGTGAFNLDSNALFDDGSEVSTGASAADIDADGDLDVFVARRGPDRLLRNDGATFADATPGELHADPWDTIGGAWGDVDGDGDLDLFASSFWTADLHADDAPGDWHGDQNTLWVNTDGDLRQDVAAVAGSRDASLGFTWSAGWWDVDGDGRPELHVVNDKGSEGFHNVLLRFEDGIGTALAATGLEIVGSGMGLAAADLNDDRIPDFLVTDWGRLHLLESDPLGWYDTTAARGLTLPLDDDRFVAWGAELADVDNDGDNDAIVVFGPDDLFEPVVSEDGIASPLEQLDGLWIRGDDGRYAQAAAAWEFDDRGTARGFVLTDLTHDGWLDVVRRDVKGGIDVLIQACGLEAWMIVDLSWASPNTDGIGARVELEADGRRWTRWIHAGSTNVASSGPPVAHFGLGDVEAVDVTVYWPDGGVQRHSSVGTRRTVVVRRE